MTGKSWKIGLLALLCAAGGVAAIFFMRPEPAITVIHPARGPAVQAVYATGTVEPVVMLPLAPRTTGRLVEILVDEGYEVKQGEVLARLEDENLQKTLTELQARADLAQKEYDRKSGLVKSGAVSKNAADQAKAERDAAAAAVERAQAELDYLKLIAPQFGLIIRRDGEIGEVIAAGQAVFWMSINGDLRIETEVDEEDISLVKPGQKAVIHADAFPGEIFNGTVSSITPKGDPVARSYRVRVALDPGSKLMIGMTAETNIIVSERENAILVPANAVMNGGKIMVVRDGKVEEVKVSVGARTAATAEILEGLNEEDIVVRNASSDIVPGQDIRTKPEKWAP